MSFRFSDVKDADIKTVIGTRNRKSSPLIANYPENHKVVPAKVFSDDLQVSPEFYLVTRHNLSDLQVRPGFR